MVSLDGPEPGPILDSVLVQVNATAVVEGQKETTAYPASGSQIQYPSANESFIPPQSRNHSKVDGNTAEAANTSHAEANETSAKEIYTTVAPTIASVVENTTNNLGSNGSEAITTTTSPPHSNVTAVTANQTISESVTAGTAKPSSNSTVLKNETITVESNNAGAAPQANTQTGTYPSSVYPVTSSQTATQTGASTGYAAAYPYDGSSQYGTATGS